MEKRNIVKKLGLFIFALAMMTAAAFMTDREASAADLASSTVTLKVASVENHAVNLTWNKVSGATSYKIWRRTNYTGAYLYIGDIPASQNTYRDTGLDAGRTYQYAVRGYAYNKKSIFSKYVAAVCSTRADKTNLTMTVNSASSVTYNWTAVNRASGYKVWQRYNNTYWKVIATVSNKTFTYTSSISNGGTYDFCVSAYTVNRGGTFNGLFAYCNGYKLDGSGSTAKMTSAQKTAMTKILYAVESGGQVYGQQDYEDVTLQYTNSSTEYAITIGAGQWYGTEAQRLLKLIHTKYLSTWEKYDTDGSLWKDVCNANWSAYKLYPTTWSSDTYYMKLSGSNNPASKRNAADRRKFVKIICIIRTAGGKACQDELMRTQIEEMENTIRALGVTNTQGVAECINIMHQGGLSSVKRILAKTSGGYTADNIYKAMQSDTGGQVGTYRTRQALVYNWIKKYI